MSKYPIQVDLVGYDGNAFVILGKVSEALRKAKAPKEDVNAFMAQAINGDYDHLLRTCCEWVEVN